MTLLDELKNKHRKVDMWTYNDGNEERCLFDSQKWPCDIIILVESIEDLKKGMGSLIKNDVSFLFRPIGGKDG